MTDGDKKRRSIFDKYSANLNLLIKHGLVNITLQYDRVYICPLCKEQFPIEALDQKGRNPLTLEDAPPKSLGGKANILTCKACNNFCGQKIDYHLTERMKELDNSKFVPKVKFNANFELDGILVQGTICVEEDGVITAIHNEKTNHPSKLETYIKKILPNKITNIIFTKTVVDPFIMQMALLKVGFLLAFEKYGYSFILHENYDKIRKQLRNPETKIYPTKFWFQAPFPEEAYGVPFVIEADLESIMPIFALKTKLTSRPFAVIIPLPNEEIDQTIHKFENKFQILGEFYASMDAMESDYLTDIVAIKKMIVWINKFVDHK